MYLDIAICVLTVLFMGWGWWRGFMRGCIGLLSTIVGFIVVVFAAGPLAEVSADWFNISGKWIYLDLVVCAILIMGLVRLLFWLVSRFVLKIKRASKTIDTIDKVAGVFLGLARAFVWFCIFFTLLYFAQAIPFVEDAANWLLNKSVIGEFLYEVTQKIIFPIIETVDKTLLKY